MTEAIVRYLPDNLNRYLAEHYLAPAWALLALVVLFLLWAFKELAFDRLKARNEFVRMGKELGFTFLSSGLVNFDVCDMRAMRPGMEVSLCLRQGILEDDPDLFIEVICFILKPSRALLAAYPSSSFMGLARPAAAGLPNIDNIPYWDWYTVRGSPPDTVREALSGVRRNTDTVFQDKWGFARMELDNGKFRCLFHFNGKPDTAQLKKLTDEVASVAAKFAA